MPRPELPCIAEFYDGSAFTKNWTEAGVLVPLKENACSLGATKPCIRAGLFFVGKMAEIYDCVSALKNLLNVQYEFLLGHSRIRERVCFLRFLESIMDDNRTVFKYNKKENAFSLIQADFLLKNAMENRNIFVFLAKSDNDFYFCRSFFPESTIDYTKGHTSWTLLRKKKILKSSGEEIVLYDRIK